MNTTMTYDVWDSGLTRHGSARDILENIRVAAAKENAELAEMDVDRYAKALIEDARYFIERGLFEALQRYPYRSDHDRALNYLAAMPSSRVRILAAA